MLNKNEKMIQLGIKEMCRKKTQCKKREEILVNKKKRVE